MAEKRRLILVRHAHRDKDEGHAKDNGLSEKGQAQAKRFAKRYAQKLKKRQTIMQSSPKKRCLETLQPLAEQLDLKVQVNALLDEQKEDDSAFLKRIDDFAKQWKSKAPEVLVVCSHGDWIPTFLDSVTGRWVELKKGGVAVLHLRDGVISLRKVIQEP